MEKITADLIFDGRDLLQNKVLVHDQGVIRDLLDCAECDASDVAHYRGILTPGFINSHCHLELSHMKGMAPTGTGLIPFIKTVVGFRDKPAEEIESGIQRADSDMWDNGIVAVGDISNKLDTASIKSSSNILYHTFVEMFDFLQINQTSVAIRQYQKVYEGQSRKHGNKVTAVPHAPYSVTPGLFAHINQLNRDNGETTVSIHNQETPPEIELFSHGTGGFVEFYKEIGMDIPKWNPAFSSSMEYNLQHLPKDKRILFVHNTLTTAVDIQNAENQLHEVYWATCPNANLYIENRLPNYQLFLDHQSKVTIGTDSLTSNWQLCILEEIKTIHKYQSYLPLEEILRWATLNGAEALGYDDRLGSFNPGKIPGINLINCEIENRQVQLSQASVIKMH